MKHRRRAASAVALSLAVILLTGRCASTGPSAPATSPGGAPKAEPAGRCQGTLGLESAPLSRAARKRLGLPENAKGALVAEVIPGGPAAAAGIRRDDLVEAVGSTRIGTDCELTDATRTRSCESVRVHLRRAGADIDVQVVPVDEETFLDQACRKGIATACYRQASGLWFRETEKSREAALDLYDKACRAGSADACAEEGLHLMDVDVRAKDVVAILDRSCTTLHSAGGCANLAFLYATGKIVKRDDRRATSLYVKSCDLGDAKGCYNVGVMADGGRGIPKDVARAVARYDEACAMGSASACTNLGFHYENGLGVSKDPMRAVSLYQKGCDGTHCQISNLSGCVNVGRAYRDGLGVAVSEPRAASIFREACERKPSVREADPDFAETGSRACSLLGALYIAGDGIPKDTAKGEELSERGCGRGDAFGCFNAAAVAFSRGDAAAAASWLDKACKAGDAEGCNDLGVAYEKGNGVPRDAHKAAELIRKSCALGFAPACKKAR